MVKEDAAMISRCESFGDHDGADKAVALSQDELVAQTISSRPDDAYDTLPWL
jgi:hypothetical protein